MKSLYNLLTNEEKICYYNKVSCGTSILNTCGCGEIGRRAGLRNQFFGVGVQVPSSAPNMKLS